MKRILFSILLVVPLIINSQSNPDQSLKAKLPQYQVDVCNIQFIKGKEITDYGDVITVMMKDLHWLIKSANMNLQTAYEKVPSNLNSMSAIDLTELQEKISTSRKCLERFDPIAIRN